MVNFTALKQIILTIISFCVNTSCLTFVVWQGIQCFTKYLDKPQGTKISEQKVANVPFPAITICGLFPNDWYGDSAFNITYLKNVCGIR